MPANITRYYVPIAGTWSRQKDDPGDWYKPGSAFDTELVGLGYSRCPHLPARTGFWSGDLNGLYLQRIFGKDKDDWLNGGRALAQFIVDRQDILGNDDADRDIDVVLIAHSHGGQVVAFALAMLLERGESRCLRNVRVVTVDMPVRSGKVLGLLPRGMGKTYKAALVAVARRWTHLYDGKWNKTRVTGSHAGPRKLEGACRNIEIGGGHSGVLRAPNTGAWSCYLDPGQPCA